MGIPIRLKIPLFHELRGVDISTLSERDSWNPELNIQALIMIPNVLLLHELHIFLQKKLRKLADDVDSQKGSRRKLENVKCQNLWRLLYHLDLTPFLKFRNSNFRTSFV